MFPSVASTPVDLSASAARPRSLTINAPAKPGLIVAVGRAVRNGTGHRAVGRQRPALAGCRACHVEQGLIAEAELLAEHERLADGDHRDSENHVVADLRSLACSWTAAVDDSAALDAEDLASCVKVFLAGAHHHGQRAGDSSADTTGYGRVDVAMSRIDREVMGRERVVDRDGRAVDEQRSGFARRRVARRLCCRRPCTEQARGCHSAAW